MAPRVVSISAVTLATRDMARSVRFYSALGFVQAYGGETATFTSFRVGEGHVNLIRAAPGASWSWWGRVILYVDDVDAMFAHARAQGFVPSRIRHFNCIGGLAWYLNARLLPVRHLSSPAVNGQIRIFGSLVLPVARVVDAVAGRALRLPFGQSLVVVAELAGA